MVLAIVSPILISHLNSSANCPPLSPRPCSLFSMAKADDSSSDSREATVSIARLAPPSATELLKTQSMDEEAIGGVSEHVGEAALVEDVV